MVLHEEQLHRCIDNGSGDGGGDNISVIAGGGVEGGSKSCKKLKARKIPQRGLGVAQLEKIRLEEQLQRQSNVGVDPITPSFDFPSDLFISPPPPILPLPPSQSDAIAYTPNSTFMASSIPSPPPPPPPGSFSGYFPPPLPPIHALDDSILASHGTLTGNMLYPMLWSPSEFSLQDVEATQKRFSSPLPLPNESMNSTIWGFPPPPPLKKRQQQQQKQLPSSPVRASASPPCSGLILQNEPPSVQNILSSCNSPLRHNEEKMVGMKRPWPFLFDNMQPLIPSSFQRPDESWSGHEMFKFGLGSTKLGEGVWPSTSTFHSDWRTSQNHCPGRNFKENNIPVDGNFLTLGPSHAPSASVVPPVPKFKQPMVARPSHFQELYGSGSVPYHGSMDDTILHFGCPAQSAVPPPPPFYSFLPMVSSRQGTTSNEQECETGDDVDLNLKL